MTRIESTSHLIVNRKYRLSTGEEIVLSAFNISEGWFASRDGQKYFMKDYNLKPAFDVSWKTLESDKFLEMIED